MAIVARMNQIIPQTCGVGFLGMFREEVGASDALRVVTLNPIGGAGWMIASFTDNPEHAEEYKRAERLLKKRWKVVYKSPVRTNKRTNRQFWFYLYDTTQAGEA